MPANVETMAYTEARGVPWHGIGTPVDGLMTAAEAIAAAGLDWKVELQDIQTVNGTPIPTNRANVRLDTGAVLGVLGTGYRPVQNSEAFDFADGLVADTGNKYETAGSLDGGKTVFLSIELAGVDPIIIDGDSEVQTFLVIANTHDGSRSLRGGVTPIRTVCSNTLNLALAQAQATFAIRHSGDITSKMAAARDALGLSIDYMRRFEDIAQRLMDAKVSDARAEAIYRDAFGMTPDIEAKGIDSDRFVNHAATQSMDAYVSTADLAPFRGTGWGVVNAAAQFLDHEKSYGKGTDRSALDVRMASVLWGHDANTLNRVAAMTSKDVASLMDRRTVQAAQRNASRVKVAA